MPPSHRLPVIALLLLFFAGCAGNSDSLNSDRIEKKYGSYGVDVLLATDEQRVSSLYSTSAGERVTRSYAVVEFLGTEHPALAATHARILRGDSIGATFRAAGFSIRKQALFIGQLDVPAAYATLAERMQIELPQALAVHQYLFIVSRDERSWNYARITEVHHPDYLDASDLAALYGEIVLDDSNRDRIHDFIGPPPGK